MLPPKRTETPTTSKWDMGPVPVGARRPGRCRPTVAGGGLDAEVEPVAPLPDSEPATTMAVWDRPT